jgi:hypothetical protein
VSNIIDTFWVLFKSNAKEVEEGAEQATAAGKKLGRELEETGEKGEHAGKRIEEENSRLAESFDKVKEHVHEFGERAVESAMEVAAAFAALFALEKLVDDVFETAEQSDQLGERAKSLGVETEELDAWGNAAKRVGGSADAFGESIINLDRQLTRLGDTGTSRMLPFFQQLGFSVEDTKKPIFELLRDLSKATEGKSKQETTGALRGIGLDEGTIRLLQRGGKELDEMLERQKKLGLVTNEDAEIAEKFNIQWDDVKQLFHSITVAFDSEFLPVLQRILEGVEAFIEYLESHKNLVTGFFIATAAAAIYAADALGIFGAVLAFVTSPITLVVAAVALLIAAFAFLYDDLVTFSEGGKSLIGELAKTFPLVGTAAHALIDSIAAVWTVLKDGVTSVVNWLKKVPKGFMEWLAFFEYVGIAFAGFVENIIKKIQDIFPGFSKLLSDVAGTVSASTALWAGVFASGFDIIKGLVMSFVDAFNAAFMFIADAITQPQKAVANFVERWNKSTQDILGIIPKVISEFDGLGEAFAKTGDWIIKVWQDILAIIDNTVGRVVANVEAVKNLVGGGFAAAGASVRAHLPTWFGGTPSPAANPVVAMLSGPRVPTEDDGSHPALAAAQAVIASQASPLMALSPQAIAGGAAPGAQTNTVIVGPTTINAPSSDPEAIGRAVDQRLAVHTSAAINQLSDGVSH